MTFAYDVKQTQWHFIAFYLRKIIFAETHYKTHDQKLLFIIAAFQQWKHYFENNYYLIIVLTNHNNLRYFIKIIMFNKHQFRWVFALVEYDFEITYYFEKINSIDDFSRRFDYEKNANDEICLFILQNKLKNIIVIIINLIFIITRDVKKTHTQREKNIIETFFFKEIDEENVEKFFNVKKNDLFHNAII